jgi:proline iminopeptidase
MQKLMLVTGILLIYFFSSSCDTHEFTEEGLLVPLTVTENPSLPSINVNGAKLHSETFGNPTDPMLVVVHGGPGGDYRSVLNFKNLANEGLFVVFYDQRGSGLSQRHDKEYYKNKTVQFFIDDLAAVIAYYRHDENQKIILAGHSWGAMLATAYINQNPEKVTGAILAEPGGFIWQDAEAYINRSFALNLFSESTNDAVYTDQFITGDDHATLDYKYGLFFSNSQTGDTQPPPFWRAGAILAGWAQPYAQEHPDEMNFTANLHQFTNKVLFVFSENNEHYGINHATLVSSAYPSIQLEEITGCGHEIIHFGWDNLYPITLNYLEEIL